MTPYEAFYGYSPPSLTDYVANSSKITSVDKRLSTRTQILAILCTNLLQDHNWIHNQANTSRSNVVFAIGDWLFLKLWPFHQTLVAVHNKTHKLFYMGDGSDYS